jgi:hypothetical protein
MPADLAAHHNEDIREVVGGRPGQGQHVPVWARSTAPVHCPRCADLCDREPAGCGCGYLSALAGAFPHTWKGLVSARPAPVLRRRSGDDTVNPIPVIRPR